MKKTIVSVATLTAITGVAASGVSADEYTITSGDTLWGIANEVGTSVSELKADNQITSDLIFPGDVLTFNVEVNVEVSEESTSTEKENSSSYIVKAGDTLSAIGAEFSIDYKEIMKWNNLSSDLIFVGQELSVEAGTAEAAPTPIVEEVVEVEVTEAPVVEEVVEVEVTEEPAVEEVVEVEVTEEPAVEEIVEVEVTEEPAVEEIVEVEVTEEPAVEEIVEVAAEQAAADKAADQAAADKAAAEQAAAEQAAADQAAADKAAAEQAAADQAAADQAAADQAAADKAAAEQAAADKAAADQAAAEQAAADQVAAEQAAADKVAAEQAAADKVAAEQAAADKAAAEQAAADKAAAEQAAAVAAAEQAAAVAAAEQAAEEKAAEAAPATPAPVQNVSNGQNYYSWGTCAWYVYEKRSSMGLSVGNTWGDAKNWASAAQSAGYSVSNSPSVGAIMQAPAYTNGAYGQGHVAVVERVNGDGSILVSEMQFGGGLGDKNTRTISASQAVNHNFIN